MHTSPNGASNLTQKGQSLAISTVVFSTVMRGHALGSRKQSSTFPSGTSTRSEVVIPASSLFNIALKLVTARRGVRNHGCHPSCMGIWSSAVSDSSQRRRSGRAVMVCVHIPPKGQCSPSDVLIVRELLVWWRTVHSWCITVPCSACPFVTAGSEYVVKLNVNVASRTRPAYGTMGYMPQSYTPRADVTNNSQPSTSHEAIRPPATVSIVATIEPLVISSNATITTIVSRRSVSSVEMCVV